MLSLLKELNFIFGVSVCSYGEEVSGGLVAKLRPLDFGAASQFHCLSVVDLVLLNSEGLSENKSVSVRYLHSSMASMYWMGLFKFDIFLFVIVSI
jgi:hypothetical protein